MARKDELLQKGSEENKLTCGLIMPISAIDGCSAEHWAEVKGIVSEAVASIGEYAFSVRLVSDQDDAGVIQKRIVQNVYNSDIVICDVSCKNPNVMFELGMRLAFDKPTVIIKDDGTDYSFDTGVIEHLNYPRDLRFSKIVNFKTALAEKVVATYKMAQRDSGHSFLSSFGTFKVAALNQTESTPDQIILDMLGDISREVTRLRKNSVTHAAIGPVSDRTASLSMGVRRYKEANNLTSLYPKLGDDAFYSAMEAYVPNLSQFNSKSEFIDALDTYIHAMEPFG